MAKICLLTWSQEVQDERFQSRCEYTIVRKRIRRMALRSFSQWAQGYQVSRHGVDRLRRIVITKAYTSLLRKILRCYAGYVKWKRYLRTLKGRAIKRVLSLQARWTLEFAKKIVTRWATLAKKFENRKRKEQRLRTSRVNYQVCVAFETWTNAVHAHKFGRSLSSLYMETLRSIGPEPSLTPDASTESIQMSSSPPTVPPILPSTGIPLPVSSILFDNVERVSSGEA